MNSLGENLRSIQQRIAEAATRAGREPSGVELMAVTKTRSEGEVADAVAAGIDLLGENRIQEAIAKFPKERSGYRLHFIGHLQRNKVKFVPGLFDCVESIDKAETAVALDRRCRDAGQVMDILFEYNTSGEASKSGFSSVSDLRNAVVVVQNLENLHLRGLMTIAPFTEDQKRVRGAFRLLRELFDETAGGLDDPRFDTLSMGMSSDFELAIEEGSTRVRVGTGLFGRRQ